MAGAVTSLTVTVATHVFVLPAPSVTVSMTLLSPRLAQLKVVTEEERVREAGEVQLSLDPPLMAVEFNVAEPEELRLTAVFLQTATGDSVSLLVAIDTVFVAVQFNLSVTVTV
jgi:hypothetical protein